MKTLNNFRRNKHTSAFTIIELLIVIVIIGILAAITVVSYTGITKKANESTLQADLATAKKQISLYYIDHGAYPTSLEDNTNCLKGATLPSPDTRYCLKATTGSAFALTDTTGTDYTLTLTKGTLAYKITKDLAPTSTVAVVAAASFVRTWGGSSADYGIGIASTTDGGYIITGYTASYGAGNNDILLAKYDASGDLSWSKTWGGAGDDRGFSIIQANDGGYAIAGHTTSYGAGNNDVILVKYDPVGNLSWSRTWGGVSSDVANSLIQTNDSGYILAGSTASFGAGNGDAFLAKFDSSGNYSWNKLWGGTNADYAKNMTKDSDGNSVITGYTNSYGVVAGDMFIAKYDTSGNLIWNKTWGGTSEDSGQGLVQASDGGYVITGYTGSYGVGWDTFLAKYDSSGNFVWNSTWGGVGSDYSWGILRTSDNGYIIAGNNSSYGAGSNDLFLAKYNMNGGLSWSKTWGGTGADGGYSLSNTSDGGYAITGTTDSYGAATDTFIAKFSPVGVINNCSTPMCQSPTTTVTTPSATITTPSATVSSPSATITTPSATITSPSATVTTVVAP